MEGFYLVIVLLATAYMNVERGEARKVIILVIWSDCSCSSQPRKVAREVNHSNSAKENQTALFEDLQGGDHTDSFMGGGHCGITELTRVS